MDHDPDTAPCACLIVAENTWVFAKPKKNPGCPQFCNSEDSINSSLVPRKSLFNQIICPYCPHFSVHIFLLFLYIFYSYPMGRANFCNIPHAHIYFSKWQPDLHDSSSEIILFYEAPKGTKFQPSPNNQLCC